MPAPAVLEVRTVAVERGTIAQRITAPGSLDALSEQGLPMREAVLEAGPVRMRPVLMTAISTIFGMLPVAFGRGDGSEWRNPMGIVAIGGLAASTLLVVPVVYTLVDDAQSALQRGTQRLLGRTAGDA